MNTAWENHERVPVTEPDWDRIDAPDAPELEDSDALVMIRRLVGFMLSDSTPSLGIECMSLVTGIGYDGSSMADIARRHHVTRAAVSRRCIDLCDAFGVPPTRAMRPIGNRGTCSHARCSHLVRS